MRKGSEGGEEEGDREGSDGEDVWAAMETVGVESERGDQITDCLLNRSVPL